MSSNCWEVVTTASLPELKKRLDSAARHKVGFLGLSRAGPGAGFSDPCGSLQTQDVLCFYDCTFSEQRS